MPTTGAMHGIAGARQGLHPAVRAVVHVALSRGEGAMLATNVEFRARFGIGAGTLQRALDLLAERDALHVVSRGHLGRWIERLGVGQCWQAAGLEPVRLLLPPSGPVEIDILESHLAQELTAIGIAHTVQHLRGGTSRIAAVGVGTQDIAVTSAGTLRSLDADQRAAVGPIRELEPGTYYAPERLVVVTRTGDGSPVRRIAIDHDSFDHTALTFGEFAESAGYEYVDVPFPGTPEHVLRGTVDAGIWHVTTSVIPLDLAGLSTRPMLRPDAVAAWEHLSGAALVASAMRPELHSVLPVLDFAALRERQQAALDAR